MRLLLIASFLLLYACGPADGWQGEWTAKWEMSKDSYPQMKGYAFEMDGKFQCDDDQVTISTYGYEGCIFQTDTSVNTQKWKVQSDTLQLINDPEDLGMSYKILEKSENKAKLQLLDDIFITLER